MVAQLPYSLKPVKLYPITSNSKAAWGLLVYLEIGSIFTAIPVSLSQSLRQLLHREIIHARPHLTAKVFRYLRTLIGKAAIDWGFLQILAYFSQLSKSVNQPTLGRIHTQYFDLSSYAKCFVLIKQSYNTILCLLFLTIVRKPGDGRMAHLIPKLRCHFAEFLNDC